MTNEYGQLLTKEKINMSNKQLKETRLDFLPQVVTQFMLWVTVNAVINLFGLKEAVAIIFGLIIGVIEGVTTKHKHLGTKFCIVYGVLTFLQYAASALLTLCNAYNGSLAAKMYIYGVFYLLKQYVVDEFSKDKLSEDDKLFYVFACEVILIICLLAGYIENTANAWMYMTGVVTPLHPESTCSFITLNPVVLTVETLFKSTPYALLSFGLAMLIDKKTVKYLFTKEFWTDLKTKLKETYYGTIYKFLRKYVYKTKKGKQ
jgi:hypothetical protein